MTQPGDQPNPWSREGLWPGQNQPAETPPPFSPPAPLPEPKSPPPFYPQPPSSPPPYPSQPPTPYQPSPERPRRTGMWMALGVVGAVLTGLAMWAVIADDRAHPAGSSSGSTGTTTTAGKPLDPRVLTATDKRSQLTVPGSWGDPPASVKNENAVILQADGKSEAYIMVISADTVDFDNFAGFADACLQEAREILEGAEIGEARPLTIGGLNAVQHVITGKANGFKIVYWYTLIEGKRGYYQLVGWTVPSRKAAAEPVILTAIESFRELI